MAIETAVNLAKAKLKSNQLVLCLSVAQMRTPNIALIAKACGFDAIFIDFEHNPTTLESASAICVAAAGIGITPIIRAGSQDGAEAARFLDSGAQGLMFPHVNSKREAEELVRSCKFPPIGHRSTVLASPSLGYESYSQKDAHSVLNRETLLIVMLETFDAIACAGDIASVEGIDVLHVGAGDLSADMGIPGEYAHPRMKEAYRTVADAAARCGKTMGVGGVRQDIQFQSWLFHIGMRYITNGSDVGYILAGGRSDVKLLKELAAATFLAPSA